MKKNSIVFFISFIFASFLYANDLPIAADVPMRESNPGAHYPISVVYPPENIRYIRNAKGGFIFGTIANPDAKLTINNIPVPVYKTGGFLAYIPVGRGDFQYILQTDDGHTAVRNVFVDFVDVDKFSKAAFDKNEISPLSDIWAMEGDIVELAAYGKPGAVVSAEIKGLKNARSIPLTETAHGYYTAQYTMSPTDKAKNAKIIYHMRDTATKTSAKAEAKGRLKILTEKDNTYAIVPGDISLIRKTSATERNRYPFYMVQGGAFLVTGKKDNDMYRINLDGGHNGWIEGNKLSFIKKPMPRKAPEKLTIIQKQDRTQIIFRAFGKTSFLTNNPPGKFEITLFNTAITAEDKETPQLYLVKAITSEKQADSVVKYTIDFQEGRTLWGYDYTFEENGDLVFDLMHEPVLTPAPGQPLKGAKIMLDPGHSPKRTWPYDGTLTPSGVFEYEINMALAQELAPKLRALGAEVFIMREIDEAVTLQERPKRAREAGAHIYISIHHDALRDEVDPFEEPRGFKVFYFQEHSKKLAEAFRRGFADNVNLHDNGILEGDFFVIRTPQYPAILTENAFMMFPQQEEMVINKENRAAFVQALYEGVLNFYGINPKNIK